MTHPDQIQYQKFKWNWLLNHPHGTLAECQTDYRRARRMTGGSKESPLETDELRAEFYDRFKRQWFLYNPNSSHEECYLAFCAYELELLEGLE